MTFYNTDAKFRLKKTIYHWKNLNKTASYRQKVNAWFKYKKHTYIILMFFTRSKKLIIRLLKIKKFELSEHFLIQDQLNFTRIIKSEQNIKKAIST